jgi:hypothetical protein
VEDDREPGHLARQVVIDPAEFAGLLVPLEDLGDLTVQDWFWNSRAIGSILP